MSKPEAGEVDSLDGVIVLLERIEQELWLVRCRTPVKMAWAKKEMVLAIDILYRIKCGLEEARDNA